MKKSRFCILGESRGHDSPNEFYIEYIRLGGGEDIKLRTFQSWWAKDVSPRSAQKHDFERVFGIKFPTREGK
jgi:hypothetical protein